MRRWIYLASAWALVAGGLAWTRVNKPYETTVYITFSPTHGLTDADLPSLAAFAVAGVLLLLARRRPQDQH